MAINLFSFVGMYDRALTTASSLLAKGVAHGGEGVLDWRLIEDMQPLRFQLAVVCNFAQGWTARAAGLTAPAEVSDDLDVAGFQAAIAAAKAWLAGLTEAQFAGRDDVALTYEIGTGMVLTLPVGQWISGFATTNFYFHLSTAYGILRSRGVGIGKVDLFAGGL